MSAGAAGASGAAAAAAAAAELARREEEEMTSYRADELGDGWEFKILRSATGCFKDPEKLRSALEEEAEAGWVLLEKFDNSRLRLKRPASARENDGSLTFDAYRTHVGTSEAKLALTILAIVFGSIALIGLVTAFVVAGF